MTAWPAHIRDDTRTAQGHSRHTGGGNRSSPLPDLSQTPLLPEPCKSFLSVWADHAEVLEFSVLILVVSEAHIFKSPRTKTVIAPHLWPASHLAWGFWAPKPVRPAQHLQGPSCPWPPLSVWLACPEVAQGEHRATGWLPPGTMV